MRDGSAPVNVSKWALLVGHDVVLLPIDRQLSVMPGKKLNVHFGNGTDTESDVYLRQVTVTGKPEAKARRRTRSSSMLPSSARARASRARTASRRHGGSCSR